MFYKIVFLFGCIYLGQGASAPSIRKCKWNDSKCIKESTQAIIPILAAGIPEMGVETLDPIQINHLDASSQKLNLALNDITGTGLKDCIAKKMTRDIKKSNLSVKFLCTVDFKATYKMSGQLLILPIEGYGNAHVLLRKLEMSIDANMGEKTKDGEKYWFVKDFKHTFQLKDKSLVELENLFPGNEVLGRAARDLIASSSNEIVFEVGPPIVKAVVQKLVANVNNFFEHIPLSEMELPA